MFLYMSRWGCYNLVYWLHVILHVWICQIRNLDLNQSKPIKQINSNNTQVVSPPRLSHKALSLALVFIYILKHTVKVLHLTTIPVVLLAISWASWSDLSRWSRLGRQLAQEQGPGLHYRLHSNSVFSRLFRSVCFSSAETGTFWIQCANSWW